MKGMSKLIFSVLILCVSAICGMAQNEPSVGYLYPAGVQRGTTTKIIVGGQYLNKPSDVYISGKGVHVSIGRHMNPRKNMKKEERYLVLQALLNAWDNHLQESGVGKEVIDKIHTQMLKTWPWKILKQDIKINGEEISDYPLLEDIENKSPRELLHVKNILFFPSQKIQQNRQLAEFLTITITVDPDASLGDRELRIKTIRGLTKSVIFQVGQLPEVSELEPNDISAYPPVNKFPLINKLLKPESFELPVLLNGQIMPGDADRFRFHARKGWNLVIEAEARRLVPYLADAVPGWFQAVLTLYDSEGKEVAYADDYMFNPDPVLFYKVPEDGEYEVEIRDSIYRGRKDFIYRVSVGKKSDIARASINDNYPGDAWSRRAVLPAGKLVSDVIPRDIAELPDYDEDESNDEIKNAQKIKIPALISGCIDKPGDIDVFQINANAGDKVAVEVYGRRLGSPLDSLLRIMDKKGKTIAWNDDNRKKKKHLHIDELGLITHHADSYLLETLSEKGTYYIQLSDAQNHGGKKYGYRLRVTAPRPDFSLCMTPSSLFTRPGGNVPVCVYALRKDGFDGAIDVTLKNDTSGRIPAGQDSVRMICSVPRKSNKNTAVLSFEGTASTKAGIICHSVIAADNVMQAFLYRHLVPSQKLMLGIRQQKWPLPEMQILNDVPVRIPVGGTAYIRIKTKKMLKDTVLQLDNPPDDISIEKNAEIIQSGMEFQLKVSEKAEPGFSANLIMKVFREFTPKSRDGKVMGKRRSFINFLPAIPVEIIEA